MKFDPVWCSGHLITSEVYQSQEMLYTSKCRRYKKFCTVISPRGFLSNFYTERTGDKWNKLLIIFFKGNMPCIKNKAFQIYLHRNFGVEIHTVLSAAFNIN